jgi:hypothetical protein
LTKTLTLLTALGALASCAPNDGCAGWRPVRASAETVDYLAAHDPITLKAMIAHEEFGQAQGCW